MEESLPFLVHFAQNFGSASLDEFEDLADYEGLSRSLDLLGRRRHPRKQTPRAPIITADADANEDDNLSAWNIETGQVEDSPMYIVHLPPQSAERICKRSVLIKGMWELYGYGCDVHSCAMNVEKRRLSLIVPSEDDALFENSSAVGEERFKIYSAMKRRRELISSPLMSWRFLVESYGVSISLSAQEGIRRHFEKCLEAQGPVKLRDSECNVTYCAILDFGVAHLRQKGLQASSCTSQTTDLSINQLLDFDPKLCEKAHSFCTNSQISSIEESGDVSSSCLSSVNRLPSRRVYFGKQVATTSRHLMGDLSLKKRPYLGPTSLDPELALIMANLGRSYIPGALVWDPFVGTGSVSVAVASLGGFPVGTEIDARVLRGKLSRNAATNFKQYGLSAPEQVRMDATRHAFRDCKRDGGVKKDVEDSGIFDSIITDPPYGIRAGSNRPGVNEMSREEWRATHVQINDSDNNKISASPDENLVEATHSSGDKEDVDINDELLELAAQMLVPGGRLVFLLPAAVDASRDQLPFHPLLRRVYSSVEPLSFALSRLVVTMEKIAPYNPRDLSLKAVYRAAMKSRTDALILSGVSIGVGSRAMQRVGHLMDEWFEVHQHNKESNELPESMIALTSINKKRSAMKRLARQQHRFEKLSSADVKSDDFLDVESRPIETTTNGSAEESKLTKKERAIVRAREAHASGKKVHIGNVPFDLSQWQEEELKEKLGLNEEKKGPPIELSPPAMPQNNVPTSSHSLVYLFIARYFASILGVSATLNTNGKFMYRDVVNGAHDEVHVTTSDDSKLSWTMRAISSGDQLSVFVASDSFYPDAESRSSKMRIDLKNTLCSHDEAKRFTNAIEARMSALPGFILSNTLTADFLTREQISLIETRVDVCVRDVRKDRNDGRIFACLLGIPDDLFIEIMSFAGKEGCSRLRATCKTARNQIVKNDILIKIIQRQRQ